MAGSIQCQSIETLQATVSPAAIEMSICGAQIFPEICGLLAIYSLGTWQVGSPASGEQPAECTLEVSCELPKVFLNLWNSLISLSFAGLGTSFSSFLFLFLLHLPPNCLVWSFQSLGFQKRQEKGLSSAFVLPPPASWVSNNLNGLGYLLRTNEWAIKENKCKLVTQGITLPH